MICQDVAIDPSLAPAVFGLYPLIAAETPLSSLTGKPDILVKGDLDLNWTISTKPEGAKWLRYRAWSWAKPLAPEQRRRLWLMRTEYAEPDATKGVSVPPRVAELARQWCSDLLAKRVAGLPAADREKLDLAIAERLAKRLREDFSYSLDFRDADPNRDGVEDFLFYMKHGHCEYFASAMTTMCRTLGVQARLATGFQIDQSTTMLGGEYIVRSRDAHAWTEVYTPGTDWVVFDATGGNVAPPRRSAVWASLTDWWWHLKSLYNDQVIGYDAQSHRDATMWLQRLFQKLGRWLTGVEEGFMNLLVYGYVDAALLRFVILLGAVALVAEGMLLTRWLRRRGAAARKGAGERLEFFEELQALLRRRGLQVEGNPTDRQLALAAARQLGLPAQTLLGLIELYYRARWGHATPTPAELDQALQTVRQLEKHKDR